MEKQQSRKDHQRGGKVDHGPAPAPDTQILSGKKHASAKRDRYRYASWNRSCPFHDRQNDQSQQQRQNQPVHGPDELPRDQLNKDKDRTGDRPGAEREQKHVAWTRAVDDEQRLRAGEDLEQGLRNRETGQNQDVHNIQRKVAPRLIRDQSPPHRTKHDRSTIYPAASFIRPIKEFTCFVRTRVLTCLPLP